MMFTNPHFVHNSYIYYLYNDNIVTFCIISIKNIFILNFLCTFAKNITYMKRTGFYLNYKDATGLNEWAKTIELFFEEFPSLQLKSEMYKRVKEHNTTFRDIAEGMSKLAKENPDNEVFQFMFYVNPVVVTQSKKDIELIEDFIRRHHIEKYSTIR